MGLYQFIGKNVNGEVVESSLDANSRLDALVALRVKGVTVIRLDAADDMEEEVAATGRAHAARAKRKASFLRPKARVSLGQKALLCRQLAISVNSGVPLRDALESIAEDLDDPAFKGIIQGVVQDLHDGKSFSEAISRYTGVFDRIFVALIRAAEESGSMAQTLSHLAGSLENSEKMRRKIRSITAYPMFVAGFFCVISAIMTLVVLPKFEKILGGFGAALPRITRAVFGINRFIINHAIVIVLVVAVAVVAFVLYKRTEPGQIRMDRVKLALPVIGDWIRKLAVARFCQNLAIMLHGGVSVTAAIEIASTICGNTVLEKSLLSARDRILSGSDIASSIAQDKAFPRLVVRMIGVGESSGRLPEVLEQVSDAYEDQVEGSIMMATSLLEPVIICVFGIVILVFILAIYVPIFTMGSQVK
jgi:type IV pilus assembly protein PilC